MESGIKISFENKYQKFIQCNADMTVCLTSDDTIYSQYSIFYIFFFISQTHKNKKKRWIAEKNGENWTFKSHYGTYLRGEDNGGLCCSKTCLEAENWTLKIDGNYATLKSNFNTFIHSELYLSNEDDQDWKINKK